MYELLFGPRWSHHSVFLLLLTIFVRSISAVTSYPGGVQSQKKLCENPTITLTEMFRSLALLHQQCAPGKRVEQAVRSPSESWQRCSTTAMVSVVQALTSTKGRKKKKMKKRGFPSACFNRETSHSANIKALQLLGRLFGHQWEKNKFKIQQVAARKEI